MKILHICNDYCGSRVHASLYSELDRLGVEQTVYAHFEGVEKVGHNRIESPRVQTIYDPVLRKIHHLMFHLRVRQVYASMCRKVDGSQFDLIHASTLFSDGALALKLHRRFRTPYVVAVRKTDVYRFLKLGPHTWPMGRQILLHASKIIFISDALKEAFFRHPMIAAMSAALVDKVMVQPNGIDDFWIDHQSVRTSYTHNLIYVGKFDDNKNVIRLIEAVKSLQSAIPDIHIDLVGGTGGCHAQVLAEVEAHPDLITYRGQVFERPLLQSLYAQNSVFCMPSVNETFGLVYVEALTQGLPVLCTRGQGIDGLFEQRVGEFVDAKEVDSIASGIRSLLANPMDYCCSVDFGQFRWSAIAERYMNLFNEIITR